MWTRHISSEATATRPRLLSIAAAITVTVAVGPIPGRAHAADSLSHYSYKASHNSYERSESADEQVDDWNVWGLELDLCHTLEAGIVLQHGGLIHTRHGFGGFLDEFVSSQTWDRRLTFLWLDIKHESVCNYWDNDNGSQAWLDQIRAVIDSRIPTSMVYTRAEFDDVDSGLWPSVDHLLDRGKHIVVILDGGHWDTDKPFHPYYFVTASSIAEARARAPWAAFVNRADASLPVGEAPQADTRYIWRAYGLNDEASWSLALDRRFHLPSSDKVDHSWTMGARTHPPRPMRVDLRNTGSEQHGTTAYPYETVPPAAARLRTTGARTILEIETGHYPQSVTFDSPLEVRARNGVVTIGD